MNGWGRKKEINMNEAWLLPLIELLREQRQGHRNDPESD